MNYYWGCPWISTQLYTSYVIGSYCKKNMSICFFFKMTHGDRTVSSFPRLIFLCTLVHSHATYYLTIIIPRTVKSTVQTITIIRLVSIYDRLLDVICTLVPCHSVTANKFSLKCKRLLILVGVPHSTDTSTLYNAWKRVNLL